MDDHRQGADILVDALCCDYRSGMWIRNVRQQRYARYIDPSFHGRCFGILYTSEFLFAVWILAASHPEQRTIDLAIAQLGRAQLAKARNRGSAFARLVRHGVDVLRSPDVMHREIVAWQNNAHFLDPEDRGNAVDLACESVYSHADQIPRGDTGWGLTDGKAFPLIFRERYDWYYAPAVISPCGGFSVQRQHSACIS